MKKWYEKDEGRTTLYGEPDDVAKYHPTAIEIPERPAPNYIWRNHRWIIDPEYHKMQRRMARPAAQDQLDAILGYLSSKPDLTPELQSLVNDWQVVNSTYPAPNLS